MGRTGGFLCPSSGGRLAKDRACYHRCPTRASGGIGRRAGFRFLCPRGRGGSTPPSPTRSATNPNVDPYRSPFRSVRISGIPRVAAPPSLALTNGTYVRGGNHGHEGRNDQGLSPTGGV